MTLGYSVEFTLKPSFILRLQDIETILSIQPEGILLLPDASSRGLRSLVTDLCQPVTWIKKLRFVLTRRQPEQQTLPKFGQL